MKRIVAVFLLGLFCMLLLPSAAFAGTLLGEVVSNNKYRWYGCQCTSRTYNWGQTPQHVSSIYAEARGYWKNPDNTIESYNYVESGFVGVGGEYPQVFGAWENYPDSPMIPGGGAQRNEYGSLLQVDTWYALSIDNATNGGSDWYASVAGVNHVHDLHLYIGDGTRTRETQAFMRSSSERWDGPEGQDSRCSFAGLTVKDSQFKWYSWQYMAITQDSDPLWGWHPSGGNAWWSVSPKP